MSKQIILDTLTALVFRQMLELVEAHYQQDLLIVVELRPLKCAHVFVPGIRQKANIAEHSTR